MSLLLLTGGAGVLRRRRAACRRWARSRLTMLGLALACGGASALNHYLDRDIDRLMGSRTEQRPVASGRVPPERGARVRARAVGVLVRAARLARQPADRAARARREPLLRPRLHALAEAVDRAEHRHRRRSRRRAAARRLRGRVRPPRLGGARDVRRRLRVDAAALLGARADDQGALRAGRRADAAGHARRPRDGAADRAVHGRCSSR